MSSGSSAGTNHPEGAAASVVFFDIGNTLASVRLTAGSAGIELSVFPGVHQILAELKDMQVALGIISDRGPVSEAAVLQALDEAQILGHLQPELVLYGSKDSAEPFVKAAAAARRVLGAGTRLVFCGEDPGERLHAGEAGFRVASHPRLVKPVVMRGARHQWLRVVVPTAGAAAGWRSEVRRMPIVPLHVTVDPSDAGRQVLYCTADPVTAAALDDLGFWVDRVGAPGEPETADLYILRDDRQTGSGFMSPAGNSQAFVSAERQPLRVLSSTAQGLVVSIPAGQSVESFHFQETHHGHNLKLMPSMGLLDDPESSERIAHTWAAAPAFMAENQFAGNGGRDPGLSNEEKRSLRRFIGSRQIRRDVDRYTGVAAVAGTSKVVSRHIHHPDNARAVEALCADFVAMRNLTVRTHRFTHEGRRLDNVEAILPAKNGAQGVVLVTAHMDSTGARQPGYSPSSDSAPGADDDASGVAGVLAAARAVLALDRAQRSRREMRFVLFNAEEHGLVGSRAYAGEQAALRARIVAVFQLDMIGHDANPGRSFELHSGFTPSPAVERRSVRLAELVGVAAGVVSPGLPAPQQYPGPFGADPAESRSDHYSFQLEGYAACLATEDFFVGPAPDSPAPDPNPNYHLPADQTVNPAYTADIARAMVAAAWLTATR